MSVKTFSNTKAEDWQEKSLAHAQFTNLIQGTFSIVRVVLKSLNCFNLFYVSWLRLVENLQFLCIIFKFREH